MWVQFVFFLPFDTPGILVECGACSPGLLVECGDEVHISVESTCHYKVFTVFWRTSHGYAVYFGVSSCSICLVLWSFPWIHFFLDMPPMPGPVELSLDTLFALHADYVH